jgi:hypothetical protein
MTDQARIEARLARKIEVMIHDAQHRSPLRNDLNELLALVRLLPGRDTSALRNSIVLAMDDDADDAAEAAHLRGDDGPKGSGP